jgi:hypothetical protein
LLQSDFQAGSAAASHGMNPAIRDVRQQSMRLLLQHGTQTKHHNTHTDYLLGGVFIPYLLQLIPPVRGTPLKINIDTHFIRILITQTAGLNSCSSR